MLCAAASFALLATAAAQVTIEVELNAGNGWVVNAGNAPYPDIAANVGDTISFTYSSSYHDVVRADNTNCDLSSATIVDDTGSYQYVVQASDTQIIFACSRGNHCVSGQQVTVNVGGGAGGAGCGSDINGDGVVDVNDLLGVLSAFGSAGAAGEDITLDGVVDVNDLLGVLSGFGGAVTCAPPPAPAPCTGCCPAGAACFAPDPACCALLPAAPAPPPAPPCALGGDCGGQVFNGCGTMCPATCGIPMGMCNMMCNNGFQCANGQFWDPLDGVAGMCVDQSACSGGGGNGLPPGMAAGRPFLSAKTVPMMAQAVEQAVSDWMGMAGPDGKHNHDGRHGGDYGQEEEL